VREKLNKIIDKYGWRKLSILFISPLLLPFFTFPALVKSARNILSELVKGNLRYLTGNNSYMAILNYFYYTEDFNIQKFGRYGKSNLLAGGNYDLRNWFHATPLSLRLMSSLGVTTMLFIAMLIWSFSFVLLVDSWSLFRVGVLFFATASTLYYITFIDNQNYNVLGWMILPFAISSLFFNDYLTFAILAFAMSLVSFTSIFVICWFGLASSLYLMSWLPLLALIPAAVKLSVPIFVSMKTKGLSKMSAALGLHKSAKYRRDNQRLPAAYYYIIILWLIFPTVYFLLFGLDKMFIFATIPALLYLVNGGISRFGDQESLYIVFLSVATFVLLKSQANICLLTAFVLSINPIYGFIGIKPHGKYFFNPAVRKPINSKGMEESIERFLAEVEQKSKILLSFKNPHNNYHNVFDGYRNFVEPLEFIANKKGITVFPDWWYVFENNQEDSPEDFWANKPESVKSVLRTYNTNYVIVYNNSEQLDSRWDKDFDRVAYLKWRELLKKLDTDCEKGDLCWWLLKMKK